GSPVPDAMIEIWQADAAGRHAGNDGAPLPNTAFKGFGRCATDREGNFSFRTLKPGSVPAPDGRPQAPHINIGLFARGLLRRLFTRIYFEGEAANDGDPVLALVPHGARKTLIARRIRDEGGLATYVFDIHLQGDDETVFFEA
ncbi:MAG: protocatechuate 3,4-dioxygenase subunit alpha, partial [Methylobacteriaceae bacterium]|nr:protocatechuate 3,4-dioxygenase subunit alpha [Methylobacteriaceae bacterium]